MATYSEVSIAGYNANPPSDDGSATSSNEVTWAKHKTKIGDPIKAAVETTQTNISTLASDFNSELAAISADLIEAGTAMLFMQTAAPTGWTKDTTANLNDTALRLVTGTVSSRTDQTAFATVFAKTATDSHTLTTTQMPAHDHNNGTLDVASHDHSLSRAGGTTSVSGSGTTVANAQSGSTGSSSPDVDGRTSDAGGGAGHTHDIDIRVNYHDVIKATKD